MRRGLQLAALTTVAVLSATFVLAAAAPAGPPGCSGRPPNAVWCVPTQ